MVILCGDKQYCYVYFKGMKDWVVKFVFEKKFKQYVRDMMYWVLELRVIGEDIEEVEVFDLLRNIVLVFCLFKEELFVCYVFRFGKKIQLFLFKVLKLLNFNIIVYILCLNNLFY